MINNQHDVLIIGSGAAGMTLALHLSKSLSVALISKVELASGSTPHAQGGVAAVFDEMDSINEHVSDTLIAGAGLCHESVVRKVVEDSTPAIQWLIDQGVPFDKTAGTDDFHLTQEGGHSRRRILHAADATGKAIGMTLLNKCKRAEWVTCYSNYMAIDLIKQSDQAGNTQCVGAYLLNTNSGEIHTFGARCVILATGGASKAYLYSSNPEGASGDGIAIAWRAGCRVSNMELNQFHPTCLYHPDKPSFLITEAIRGEGGILKLTDGTAFMESYHPKAELAPRDVVARAIDTEMKKHGLQHVYLDISHKPDAFIEQHFPTVFSTCLSIGIDIRRQPIPVVPAAHYTCGGVLTDDNGQTDLDGLYAIGETACTGLHGANRMASNSLLECISFGRFAASHINKNIEAMQHPDQLLPWDDSRVTLASENILLEHNWEAVRRIMWNYVGIIRKTDRLERAKRHITLLKQECEEYYHNFTISPDLIELRNLSLVAQLIVESSLLRKESRGLHSTLDYPNLLPIAQDSVLTPPDFSSQQSSPA